MTAKRNTKKAKVHPRKKSRAGNAKKRGGQPRSPSLR
jgi:hypothetical protein